MKNSFIKQIKKHFDLFQLILTTVLITSSVNYLVFYVISYYKN